MGLAGVLGIALTIQFIELFRKTFIDVAWKRVLENIWFNTQIDYYRFERLSLNYYFL